jgi:hypothetical protein
MVPVTKNQTARAAIKLSDALTRVLNRMDSKGETLEEAVEAVYPDFGDMKFRAALIAYAQGK